MSKDQTVSICCRVPNTGKIADVLYKDKKRRGIITPVSVEYYIYVHFLFNLTIPSNSTA